MEKGGNMFMGNRSASGQTCNNSINLAWDIRELNPTLDWENNNSFDLYASTTTRVETTSSSHSSSTLPESDQTTTAAAHAMMFLPHHHLNQQQHSLYTTGDGSNPMHPDPHLVCLKLGKRHYFEDTNTALMTERHLSTGGFSIGKKGKPYYNNLGGGIVVGGGGSGGGEVEPSSSAAAVMGPPATVPRCQVEGCHVALVNAKDYHRRHKVCEMHSKAPKVVVLGLEQRFCQQCSRFHVVSEFDDSKRSCRRRLAGHNERRRKSSHDSAASRNSVQDNKLMAGRFPFLSSPTGRALSLLSSRAADSWISPSDLSSRSSAALRELIAENRASILARQLILDRDLHLNDHHAHAIEDLGLGDAQPQPGSNNSMAVQQHVPSISLSELHGWDRFPQNGAHHQVTLDLMQASSSAFGMLSMRGKTKEEEEDQCSQLWNSWEGTHVV